jgi:hypothetical protein
MLGTKLGDLEFAATMIHGAQKALDIAEEAWVKAAKPCKYCQEGGDGLECAYMGEDSSDDPFCYSTNCPLINK